jgi:cytochrome d ubiquinol oxidase subunit II
MHLYDVPLAFALIGLALYVVLSGADFGAALWQAGAGCGPRAQRLRDHAHHAMGPVWEANHVWLIFVLTVVWTAYPVAFGSIASTLSIPLFAAGIGIIVRGAAYALRAGSRTPRERRLIDTVSSASSLLTPFALGAAVGAIASRRVPVGNAAGDLVSSWLNPTSLLVGALAVVTAAYLAAVFLAADAVRHDEPELEGPFRARALGAGTLAGVLAVAGLAVLHADAPALSHTLVAGPGLPALVASALAGLATLALVWAARYEPARYTAALAVAAIVAGWGLAQQPTFLPGLTVRQAAAPHDTLVAVTVAVLAGGVLLFPSLGLLFRLALGGRLGHGDGITPAGARPARAALGASAAGLSGRLAVALLLAGIGLLTVADAGWAHGLGVACLLGFVAAGFLAVAPAEIAAHPLGASHGIEASRTKGTR